MSQKPLTDEERLAVEVWACSSVDAETTLVLRLLSDFEAARSALATVTIGLVATEAERDEMRDARDRLIAETDRLRARLADVDARAEGLDVTEDWQVAR